MIELNLLERKAPVKLPTVLGVDLNSLNFKLIGIALVIFFVPEAYLSGVWEEKIEVMKQEIVKVKKEEEEVNKELGDKGSIKAQLEAYNNQVEKLKERSAQVDNILKEKTNPRSILEKVARSLSDEIWFDRLSINAGNEMIIQGGAYSGAGIASYRVIGQFVNLLNESPYFNGSVTIATQSLADEQIDGIKLKYDKFEIRAKIKNFDTFSR